MSQNFAIIYDLTNNGKDTGRKWNHVINGHLGPQSSAHTFGETSGQNRHTNYDGESDEFYRVDSEGKPQIFDKNLGSRQKNFLAKLGYLTK